MFNKGEVLEAHFGTKDQWKAFHMHVAESQSFGIEAIPSNLSLPYSVPADELPAPIPTIDEIAKCRDTNNNITSKRGVLCGAKVYKVNGYAVKFHTSGLLLQEAENHLYIQQNTTIRIPKMYAVYSEPSDPTGKFSDRSLFPKLPVHYYLIMEFIEGETVQDLWNSLDENGRTKIGTEIGQMFEKLQSVPSSGYYGRIHHLPYPPCFMLLRTHSKEGSGPYDTYAELVEAIFETSKLDFALTCFGSDEYLASDIFKLTYTRKELSRCGGQESRLTYLDPKFDNIMLKPIPSREDNKTTDYEVIFIDWQHLAWLPAWFQSSLLPLEESIYNPESKYKNTAELHWHMIQAMPSFRFAESLMIPQLLTDFYSVW